MGRKPRFSEDEGGVMTASTRQTMRREYLKKCEMLIEQIAAAEPGTYEFNNLINDVQSTLRNHHKCPASEVIAKRESRNLGKDIRKIEDHIKFQKRRQLKLKRDKKSAEIKTTEAMIKKLNKELLIKRESQKKFKPS